MAFADDDGSTFESYGGGWHLIVPSSKEEHLKLFEVVSARSSVRLRD